MNNVKVSRKVKSIVLIRKVRRVGNSLSITIPSQLAEMMGIREGNQVQFDYLGDRTLRVKALRFTKEREE